MTRLMEPKGNSQTGELAGACAFQGRRSTHLFCFMILGSSNMLAGTDFVLSSSPKHSSNVGIVFTILQKKKLKVRCSGSHGQWDKYQSWRKPHSSHIPGPIAILCWLPKKNRMHEHPEEGACMSTQSLKRMCRLYPTSVPTRWEERGAQSHSSPGSSECSGRWPQAVGKTLGQVGLFWLILHLITAPCHQEWREVWEATAQRSREEILFEHTFKSHRGRPQLLSPRPHNSVHIWLRKGEKLINR